MSRRISESLKRRVRRRAAGGRCEYCQMPESVDQLEFQFDHVIARQHRGATTISNLAFCCAYCNAHKGTNLAGIDPVTRQIVRIFNPRRDRWASHFRWHGARLVGTTAVGRTTILVLAINDPINVAVRRSLVAGGLFR